MVVKIMMRQTEKQGRETDGDNKGTRDLPIDRTPHHDERNINIIFVQ